MTTAKNHTTEYLLLGTVGMVDPIVGRLTAGLLRLKRWKKVGGVFGDRPGLCTTAIPTDGALQATARVCCKT